MGLQACVECPFKLFKAQSGVFFLPWSKDGYQRSVILPSRVTFPTFPFSTDTLTHLHSLSLSLMLSRTLSWSHAATYVHARRHLKSKAAVCIYTRACIDTLIQGWNTCTHLKHTHTHTRRGPSRLPCIELYCVCQEWHCSFSSCVSVYLNTFWPSHAPRGCEALLLWVQLAFVCHQHWATKAASQTVQRPKEDGEEVRTLWRFSSVFWLLAYFSHYIM